ncbi:IS3 family transposase [Streptomyces pratens]|uniref:IS3 family transposase n=1 Tax=Streptomyces pratens TaxID=887456 RepID=A0ABW1M5E8_9ACTN
MLIKTECIRGRTFDTRAEANLALFEYLDGFYNPRRIQKRLGYLSPIEYEEKHYANQAAAEPVNLKPPQPILTGQSATPAQRGNLSHAVLQRPGRRFLPALRPSAAPEVRHDGGGQLQLHDAVAG